MLAINLTPGIPGGHRACLRALCGADEALIQDGDPREIIALLKRLVVDSGDGTITPEQIPDLPICDVDRLIAGLHLRDLGDQIESRAVCAHCQGRFELSFSLRGLLQSIGGTDRSRTEGLVGPDEERTFRTTDGLRFRLPTTRDLDATAGLSPETAAERLRRGCVLEGDPERDPRLLEESMAAVGPVLDVDLDAECPHCATTGQVRFEMQGYLARALAFERRFLNHEVHQMALAYGWSRSEILDMPRADRRAHAQMILAGSSTTARRRTAAIRT
jgi:hypothetical protein